MRTEVNWSAAKISGGPIEGFREGWALVPFVGSFGKPHYFRRIELTNRFIALCGLTGSVMTHEMAVERGMPHFEGVRPLEPGDFMVNRCKLCSRKRSRMVSG